MTWRPIEGTHLGWAVCATCPAEVLSVPEYAGRARCGTCAAPQLGLARPAIGPVAGYSIGRGPAVAPRPVAAAERREPRIPARPAWSDDEIAPRALPIGHLAADLGWTVVPWYWLTFDLVEASVLVMSAGPLRALARWERGPGGNWKTTGSRAWREGETFPTALGVTKLVELIEQMGEVGNDDSTTAR